MRIQLKMLNPFNGAKSIFVLASSAVLLLGVIAVLRYKSEPQNTPPSSGPRASAT